MKKETDDIQDAEVVKKEDVVTKKLFVTVDVFTDTVNYSGLLVVFDINGIPDKIDEMILLNNAASGMRNVIGKESFILGSHDDKPVIIKSDKIVSVVVKHVKVGE